MILISVIIISCPKINFEELLNDEFITFITVMALNVLYFSCECINMTLAREITKYGIQSVQFTSHFFLTFGFVFSILFLIELSGPNQYTLEVVLI